ncbi:MAG: BlaI/MecI/CopY family transcriptional regulator [Hyphomonadaceae bacterium]|nr:BlaI/MecI/CopY family transcriptional regulator [Hyphomonadaceae bacterium]
MLDSLPPRERQIVDLLYAKGEATVGAIQAALPVALSEQAIRAMLSRLEKKGFVRRRASEEGLAFSPAKAKAEVKDSVLKRIVNVFFDGSALGAGSALLGMAGRLSEEELEELERVIAKARKERRK